jgi:hypothetical protein
LTHTDQSTHQFKFGLDQIAWRTATPLKNGLGGLSYATRPDGTLARVKGYRPWHYAKKKLHNGAMPEHTFFILPIKTFLFHII